ncbi:Phosphatidylinositol/phosphatidylcholine transfer protein SFH2, partial [Mucuna pruriens]
MGLVSQDALNQLQALMDQVEEPLLRTFQNVHQGFVTETLMRFLKAREWNATKAHKMIVDCLNWRVQSEIDKILSGLPVFAIGVGLSTFDKASVHYYVQSHIQINEYRDRVILPSQSKKHERPITTCVKVLDMTGLKLSALNQIKLLTIISSIDDLNYPEKTNTYYIVNAPYIFSACWKVVKPLLQERTRRKVQVLSGCGRDELLKIMDYASLPHFCRREGSGSSRHSENGNESCYSLDHPFHQNLYNYIKEKSRVHEAVEPIKQGSFHVDFPEPPAEKAEIVKTLESELQKFKISNESGD